MKSLTSDANDLQGEPLQFSALLKDITSLNVARQQELVERLFKIRRLELQIGQLVKNDNLSA